MQTIIMIIIRPKLNSLWATKLFAPTARALWRRLAPNIDLSSAAASTASDLID